MKLSEKIIKIQESGTMRFTPLIKTLRKEGKQIINFAVGEPDIAVPKEVINATKKALDENKTKYADVSGISELKTTLSNRLNKDKLSYDAENITITNGSKQALYNIFQAICNPKDEVIIPKPCWPSFGEQVKLAEANPVFVDTVHHQLDIEKIKKVISKKTKAIIINNPNNPTGAVYKTSDLKAIADLAIDYDFFIVCDNAYSELIYDDLKPLVFAKLSERVKQKTININSFSKIYSMTGFRIGYITAEKEIISAVNKLQGCSTGNVCTFAQYGAVAALNLNKKTIQKRVDLFEKRRNLSYRLTTELFDCIKPQGAFYLFPDVSNKLTNEINTSEKLSYFLLKKTGVAMVPGEVFYAKNHLRISYAVSEQEIKKGFEKIKEAL